VTTRRLAPLACLLLTFACKGIRNHAPPVLKFATVAEYGLWKTTCRVEIQRGERVAILS